MNVVNTFPIMRYNVAKYMITPTINVSIKNIMTLLKKSGTFVVLVKIFRIIRPLLVAYPVLTTTTLLSYLDSRTFAP